jgi:hypothetical protein
MPTQGSREKLTGPQVPKCGKLNQRRRSTTTVMMTDRRTLAYQITDLEAACSSQDSLTGCPAGVPEEPLFSRYLETLEDAHSMDGYSDADSKLIQEEEGPPYSMVGSQESPAEENYNDTAEEESPSSQRAHTPQRLPDSPAC